ncbi:hypothetical protein ACOQFO_12575 [Ureibacillus sp. MALMAid1270]|uniref:hypothetical protein n=1 Tax=Ureibacillus sp. MALMAid1270 TaxID=3411629 RepID=UPI003BA4159C
MKTKLRMVVLVILSLFILAGCSAKSAEQHGSGISIEMDESLGIKHMTIITYVDGKEVFSENVINADNSAFGKGEVIWFDVSPFSPNTKVELAISYSQNINATQSKTTPKKDISKANKWVNVMFSGDYQLNLIDMD